MTPQTNTSDTAELSGSITESGSTTVQPLAQELADAFHAKYPKVNIVIQGGGTAVGIKAAQDGTTDIGAASRDLTDEEKTTVVSFVLARDAVVAVVLT
jgi:phosphate transport system substrate-binding protein